jgi:hypothetical protein
LEPWRIIDCLRWEYITGLGENKGRNTVKRVVGLAMRLGAESSGLDFHRRRKIKSRRERRGEEEKEEYDE